MAGCGRLVNWTGLTCQGGISVMGKTFTNVMRLRVSKLEPIFLFARMFMIQWVGILETRVFGRRLRNRDAAAENRLFSLEEPGLYMYSTCTVHIHMYMYYTPYHTRNIYHTTGTNI